MMYMYFNLIKELIKRNYWGNIAMIADWIVEKTGKNISFEL